MQTDGERLRKYGWAALGVYLCALGIASALRHQGDFAIYYLAGQRALTGDPLYPPSASNHFLYAPVFALVFAPFASLPVALAQLAWFVCNAIGLIAFILGSARLLVGPDRPSAAVLFVPVLLCIRFVGNNVEHGQINLIVLALIVWAMVRSEKRSLLSGLLLACAVLIKPFALLAGWWLLLERRGQALLWTIAACIFLLAVPFLLMGPTRGFEETAGYVRAVISTGNRYPLMLTNQSASSAAMRLIAGTSLDARFAGAIGLLVESGLVIAVSIWILRSQKEPQSTAHRLSTAALFCLMPSLAPVSWKSYYVALIVPHMALSHEIFESARQFSRSVWVAIVLSVVLNFAVGRGLNHLALYYSAHFVSSLLVLAACYAAARDTSTLALNLDSADRPKSA